MKVKSSPWLGLKIVEYVFILAPPFLATLMVCLFNNYFTLQIDVSTIWWIILVVGIDVSHVYSTLYRTYWDAKAFKANKLLFTYTPLLCLLVGIILYAINSLLFWRVLAYLAVFHFMRQQYGLMRLYSRHEDCKNFGASFDMVVIYSAVLYPILFWHTQTDRNFNWFIEGDFWLFPAPTLASIFGYIYITIVLAWSIYTLWKAFKFKEWNTPKNLIIIGTIISWYAGIVAFNGDLIFTCLNVLAHGIPYMALVWIYGYKQHHQHSVQPSKSLSWLFKPFAIGAFIGFLLLFAYLEEGIWDALVWQEHREWFPFFNGVTITPHPLLLNILIPLLSIPQATHYVLDAYIWKIKKPETMPYLLNQET